ncbi:hypothetical protein N7466_006731 [Penicillium verhagenii]|uniref:uncharacterized protein n=1 Tax=Penicillium verhagenii TaxID=1562060 RepID=UPI0025452A64|nr:uncharacterized protein N7466_006731 [Penicillium verhagenii]KAJ5927775.1 hypothetical protein N7466_006731 [Penicillium verhagenii]
MAFDFDAARIESLPTDAFYISDFISEDEEARLIYKVQSAPLPHWTHLSHRRLQSWPSTLTKSDTLLASPLPSWLADPVMDRFNDLGVFTDAPHGAPNHVLVNEYHPGQGILPHEDGPAYYPLVATVSLGAPIVLDLYEKNTHSPRNDHRLSENVQHPATPRFRILQERRSLLIMQKSIYTDFLHGIAEVSTDKDLGSHSICNWNLLREQNTYCAGWYPRETRTSITYRDVLKVAKMGDTLKFLGRAS